MLLSAIGWRGRAHRCLVLAELRLLEGITRRESRQLVQKASRQVAKAGKFDF